MQEKRVSWRGEGEGGGEEGVPRGVTGEFEHFGDEVLEGGGEVDCRGEGRFSCPRSSEGKWERDVPGAVALILPLKPRRR